MDYQGVKPITKLDTDFEFEWFLRTVNTEGDFHKLRSILEGLFCGVMRLVHNHKWLKECPKGIDLSNTKLELTIEQNDNGRFINDILGRWEVTLGITEGETTVEAIIRIMNLMERFVRARFDLKEPQGIDAIALEYNRSNFIKEHFVGYAE